MKQLMSVVVIIPAVLLTGIVLAEPIYMHVDKDGKRVFSDKPQSSSSEVKLKSVSTVSGAGLGKRVYYAGGQPDSGREAAQHYRSSSVDERERQDECERKRASAMRVMGNSGQAGLNACDRK